MHGRIRTQTTPGDHKQLTLLRAEDFQFQLPLLRPTTCGTPGCDPHRQPLHRSTRHSTLLVCCDCRTVAAPRHGATGQAWASNDALSKALAPTRVPQHLAPRTPDYWAPTHTFWTLDFGVLSLNLDMSACIWSVCVYYCRTYDKVVCGGGKGQ